MKKKNRSPITNFLDALDDGRKVTVDAFGTVVRGGYEGERDRWVENLDIEVFDEEGNDITSLISAKDRESLEEGAVDAILDADWLRSCA